MRTRDDHPHAPVVAGGQIAEVGLDRAHRRSQSAPLDLTELMSALPSLRRGSQGRGGESRSEYRRSQNTQTQHFRHQRAASLSTPTEIVSVELLTGGDGGRGRKVEILPRSGQMTPGYREEDKRPPLRQRAQTAPIARTRDALVPSNEATYADTPQGSSDRTGRFRDGRNRAATLHPQACQWDLQAKGQDGEAAGAERVNFVACGVDTPPEKPLIPELNEHGSSDSTVGIGGSPQFFPEGIKTDDEDGGFKGRGGLPRAELGDPHTAVCGNKRGVSCDGYGRAGTNSVEAVDGGGNPDLEIGQGDDEDDKTIGAGEGRRDSLLDTYREPEGHDWGELEDWQGLPGFGHTAGGDSEAGTVSTLQAPALIFRPGRVVEGDVLSLLGRPRSRQPGEASPAKHGPTPSVDPDQSDTIATLSVRGAIPNGMNGPSKVRDWSTRGYHVGDDLGGDAGNDESGEVHARGGSAQPLLLSLADLTTASLEKMLQARHSKMYFDPDAQRWVGEEVDLSGFEDPSSGHGSSPRFSLGSPPTAAVAVVRPSPRHERIAESPRPRVSTSVHRRWSSSGDTLINGPASRRQVRVPHSHHTPPPPPPPSSSSREGGVFHKRRHSSLGVVPVPSESGSSGRRSRSKIRSRSGSHGSSCASASLRSDSDTGSVVRLPRNSIPEGDSERLVREDILTKSGAEAAASTGGGGSSGETVAVTAGTFFGGEGKDLGAGEDKRNMEAGVSTKEAGEARMWGIRGVSPSSALAATGDFSLEALESEMGASEASDWDQDSDFGGIPENHPFELTFEQPAKFGYSPAFTPGVGFAGGVRSGDGGRGASEPPPVNKNRPPMSPPGLFRHLTAPVQSRNFPNSGKAGPLDPVLRFPMKASSDGWDRSGGAAGSEEGRSGRIHQRSYTDHRCDSLGSAAEWDQTLEGDLDLSLARRPRSSSGMGQPKPQTPSATMLSAPSNQNGTSKSGPLGDDGMRAENADVGKCCSSPKGSPKGSSGGGDERSAMGRYWDAFRARRGDDSLQATVKVAAAALAAVTSSAVEHLRNRGRKRMMQEKGSASGKRLSGPVQITLEDLQAPPSPIRVSNEGGIRSGEIKIPSPGTAAATARAFFNRDKMRWEGFEEPDLDGFDTSDSEPEPEPEPCEPCTPHGGCSRSSLLMGGAWGEGEQDGNEGSMVEDCLAVPGAGMASMGGDSSGNKAETSEGLPLVESSTEVDAGEQERIDTMFQGKDSAASPAGGVSNGGRVEEFIKTWKDSLCGDDNSDGPETPVVREEEVPDGSGAVAGNEHEQITRVRGSMEDLLEGAASVGARSDREIESNDPADLVVGDVIKSSSRHSVNNSEVSDSEVSDWDRSLVGSPALGGVGDIKLKVLGGTASKGGGVVCRVSPAAASPSPLGRSSQRLEGLGEGGVVFSLHPEGAAKSLVGGGVGVGGGDGIGRSSGASTGRVLITPSARQGGDGDRHVDVFEEAVEAEGSKAVLTRSPAGSMVTRNIHDGRAGESTEDDALDDYGEDFLDTIVLNPMPRGPGSSWGLGQTAFQEEDEDNESGTGYDVEGSNEGSDDSRMATCAFSPPRGNRHSNAPGNPLTQQQHQQQRIFDESSPHHEHASYFSSSDDHEDETSWSAPEMSADSSAGGTMSKGGWGIEGEGLACGRWRNYGPAIRRVSIGGVFGGVFGGCRQMMQSQRVEVGEFSSAEEEDIGRGERAGDAQAEADLRYLPHFCPKRRGRRSRGYQTITKAEYTPIYVPNAWLNPKTGSWEPVDGFEVDMSGFGGGESDDSSGVPSSACAGRGASPPPLSLTAVGGGSTGGAGEWPYSTGGGSLLSPPLGRGHSGASSTGTTTGGDTPVSREGRRRKRKDAFDRAAAFRLSPERKQRFARSEEAHDRAMTLLLGEQGYARSKQKSATRLRRLPGVSHPDEKQEDVGKDLAAIALPEPAPGTPASLPRPRTRSVGPGIFVAWSRGVSGSSSSIESGSGSPAISSSSKTREEEKDTAKPVSGDVGFGNEGFNTPSHSRQASATTSMGVKGDSPLRLSPCISARSGSVGNNGDACERGSPSRNCQAKFDARVSSGGENVGTGVSRSGVSRAGTGASVSASVSASAGGSVGVSSRRGLSATSSREASKESSMAGDGRLSPRRALLLGVGAGIGAGGNSSTKAAVVSIPKGTSSTELNACVGSSSGSVDRHLRRQSPARQSPAKPSTGKGRGEIDRGTRDSPRLRAPTPAVDGKHRRQAGSDAGAAGAAKANTGGSRPSFGRGSSGGSHRRQASYTRGSPESAPPLRRRASRKGLVGSGGGAGGGRSAGPSRRALSPWRSPHVLRSPPRRALLELGVRGSVGGGLRRRRATLSSSPMSPLSLKALHRTSSTGRLSAMLRSASLDGVVGGQVEGVAEEGQEAAAAVLSERERVKRRLARFGDMADFATDTIKERFSLLGTRNFPESAQRRTHRRRRSGGESSTGSGSSAGLATAIGGLTVRR